MVNIKKIGKIEAVIRLDDLIDLLEIKLASLKEAEEKDSSWNYGIKELEEQIADLKSDI